ncbi:MAG: ABC transporter permease [Deltaproteobacteria bacterium]|jgi:ABC-2 type transport system permease protein|nr:ABC transporter permease [Deltaproteobacteria bacterium]
MDNVRRVIALMYKEFVMILKDPKSRFVIIGPPLIQFFVFGYAATYDLKNVRYAVFDESRSPESRQLLSRLEGSENFELTKTLLNEKEIAFVIDREKARLVVHIGSEFSRDLHNGHTATLQIIVDGRNSNVALIALGYIRSIVEQYNKDLVQKGVVSMDGPGLVLVDRAWFNGNLQSRWFIVSALGGLISMVVVMILTSLSVAREREFGTFDQLLVAPFSTGEILIGKSLPGIFFGLMDALLFAAGAVYWFGVPFRGTIGTLILALGCFIITIVGVGLLVSSLSMTMQQALLGSFVFMMPSVILSGFATPIENMPHWLQIGTLLNPLRHIIGALRDIFLQGADVSMIWHQIWPLMLMAGFTLPLAGWLFRHRSQ